MIVRRERPMREHGRGVGRARWRPRPPAWPERFRRIGVALEALPSDSAMLAEAIALAKTHRAELVLMHVVDGAGGHWYGPQTGDAESRQRRRLSAAAWPSGCARELAAPGRAARSRPCLGYGNPPREIANLTRQNGIDLVVLGGHGHKPLLDLLRGETDLRRPPRR